MEIFNMTLSYPDSHAQGPNYQQWRQMTINELLMENRIIFIDMPLSTQMYMQYGGTFGTDIIKKLLRLQYLKKDQDIHMYINCPGGSVGEILAIYDTMQYLSCEIATYCVGVAFSGAALLLAAGTKGKRYALPHSKIMIHQPWGGVTGQAEDISIQAEQILQDRRTMNELIAKHTGQSVEKIEQETERDHYLTVAEAKIYGLLDEVLEPERAAKVIGGQPVGGQPAE
jgi:ATP-dependent Clp protease, protease subunit